MERKEGEKGHCKAVWECCVTSGGYEGYVPSLKVFESWEEIYALALVRVMDYIPLKRVKAVWEKLYMKGLSPNLNPKKLSAVLREVGLDREGQNAVFNCVLPFSLRILQVAVHAERERNAKQGISHGFGG